MPARRTDGANVWTILSVGAFVVVSVFGFVWSIITAQITDVKNEMLKMSNDARWVYASKEAVNEKIQGLKDEELAYRKGLERILVKP